MGTDDNTSVAIGVSGVTITLSQDGVDDLYDDDIAGDIGISGAMGDLTYLLLILDSLVLCLQHVYALHGVKQVSNLAHSISSQLICHGHLSLVLA
jgi:hypothetical protein